MDSGQFARFIRRLDREVILGKNQITHCRFAEYTWKCWEQSAGRCMRALPFIPADNVGPAVNRYRALLLVLLRKAAREPLPVAVHVSALWSAMGFGNRYAQWMDRPFRGPPSRPIHYHEHKTVLRYLATIKDRTNTRLFPPEILSELEKRFPAYATEMGKWDTRVHQNLVLPRQTLDQAHELLRRRLAAWKGMSLSDPDTFMCFVYNEVIRPRSMGKYATALRTAQALSNLLRKKPTVLTRSKRHQLNYLAIVATAGAYAAYQHDNRTMERFFVSDLEHIQAQLPDPSIERTLNTHIDYHCPSERTALKNLQITQPSRFYGLGVPHYCTIHNAAQAALFNHASLDSKVPELGNRSPSTLFHESFAESSDDVWGNASSIWCLANHARWLIREGKPEQALRCCEQGTNVAKNTSGQIMAKLHLLRAEGEAYRSLFQESGDKKNYKFAFYLLSNAAQQYRELGRTRVAECIDVELAGDNPDAYT